MTFREEQFASTSERPPQSSAELENPVLGAEGEVLRLEKLRKELTEVAERAIVDGLLEDDVAHELHRAAIEVGGWGR